MIILLSFVMCFRSIGRFYVNNVYICTSITNIVYMSDRQQFIIPDIDIHISTQANNTNYMKFGFNKNS